MGTWKTYKLGEVAKVIMGQSPESQYYNTAGSGLPFHQGVASFGERFVKTEQYTSVYSKVAQPGDILFSVRAPVGRLNLTEETIAIGRGLAALRAKEDVDKIFLFYALKRKFFKDNLIGSGAIFAAVSRNELESQELPLPPLEEQERIAGVLGAYDDLIAVNERRMALLEEAAHRLYRDRFITHADPDWEQKPLSDVCTTIQNGGTPNRSESQFWENGTIDWFKTKELKDSWLFTSEERITEAGLRHSATRLYPTGTILMAIYASPTLGRLGVLAHEATCNQAALGFIVDETLTSRWWLFHTLRGERDKFNQVARGAGQQNISSEIVKGWKVPVPPPTVMQEFEEKVKVYWEAIGVLARENVLLREGRDKLLPRLLREEA